MRKDRSEDRSEKPSRPEQEPPDADPIALPDLPGITLTPVPLSRGPQSAVYRGWDRVHRCDVIVKVLRRTGDPVIAERFRREAAVMARLRHPNIVTLYQFHDGDPSALVMEYVPGRTLADLVEVDGRLAPAQVAQIIEEVAAALDRIHAADIVHRDVKPSNILLSRRGPARLTDFGISHVDAITPLTVMGDILGTIEYASPEQVQGNSAPDARSDVYSLAAVAYFMLAGTPPFRAADSSSQAQLSVMHQQVWTQPPPLRVHRADIAAEIEAAVLRGLAKLPDARYPSAGQFAATLRSAVETASGVPELPAMAMTSRRTGARTGALAGATLLACGAFAAWKMQQPAAVSVPVVSVPVSRAVPARPASGLTAKARPKATPSTPARIAALPAKPRQTALAASVPTPAATPVRVAVAGPREVHHEVYHEVHAVQRLAKKVVVTERPLYRRHPSVVASAARPASSAVPAPSPATAPSAVPAPSAAPGPAWLALHASQDRALPGQKSQVADVPARLVTVDGRPVPALTGGGWAALPSGRHLISYVPAEGSGFGRNPGLWVTLEPGAHVSRQVLLPAAARPHLAAAPHLLAPVTLAAIPTPAAPTVAPVGWYTLSGWAASTAPGQDKPTLTRAAANWVKVDGHPVAALGSGRWAALPAGRHTITFQPAAGLGVGPKTWDIDLAAQAHLDQQIPLPPVGWYTVSGWLARDPSAPKPDLARTSAQWVKVDGQPVLSLALGQWAELPAGRHTVTFQPTTGVGVGPKTWDIDLAPQGHLDQKIPLAP